MDKPKVKVFTKVKSRTVLLKDIKIRKGFKLSQPDEDRQALCFTRYIDNGYFDRSIILDDDGFLKDGYIAYLVAKALNIEKVEVSQIKTVFVFPEVEEETPPEPIKKLRFWQRVFGKGVLNSV